MVGLGMFLGHLLVIFVAYYTLSSNFKDIRRFRTDPNYHTQTRSRQNLWINGKQTKLPKDDPGGEHE